MSTILCPVDFSESSDAAVDLAVAAAYARGSRLALLHVDPPPTTAERLLSSDNYKTLRRQHDEWLESRLATARLRLNNETEVDAISRLKRGAPADQIIDVATELGVELIVMASHSSRLRRALLGSVAERVARAAPCPILLARGETYAEIPFKRLLLCIDFTSLSHAVIAKALKMSDEHAHIELLHVVDEPSVTALQASLGEQGEVVSLIDTLHKDARHRLEKFTAELPITTKPPQQTVIGGPIAATILSRAAESKADLIVVGSHRPHGLKQRLVGTVADRILHHAEIPVLLCPAS